MNPLTGQLLGPNSTLAIGTLVPGTGNPTNGLFLGGQGIVDTTYTLPALALAPRFGMAYDLTGTQKIVLRGGVGLFYDRPCGNSVIFMPGNPPTVAERHRALRRSCRPWAAAGSTTRARRRSTLSSTTAKLPSSTQWNGGVQMALPWAIVARRRVRRPAQLQLGPHVNINAVDFGAAFLPQNQDPNARRARRLAAPRCPPT